MRFLGLVWLLMGAGMAVAQSPLPHPAWSQDEVHEIRLRFSQPDWWERLTANYRGTLEDAEYLEAALQWGPHQFASVGVRFKGNSSYSVNSKKKPFRLKLNEFVKGQKIAGVGAFNLNNLFGDASFVREAVYYELARAAGLRTPRSGFAALYINDVYWGLYGLGEVVNDDFLQSYFGRGEDKGNLYKGDIGATFAYLGPDKAAYKQVWEKQTNEAADDWSDLIDFCKALNETPASSLEATMTARMDLDSFLTAMALDNATGNLDGYVGMAQNFNFYRRPSDGRWVWMPWDPSLAFGAFPGGPTGSAAIQMPVDRTVPAGNSPNSRPLSARLLSVPAIRARYLQIYRELVAKVVVAEPLLQRMERWRALIRPHVGRETERLSTLDQFDRAMTTAAGPAPGLRPFVTGRLESVRSQLTTLSAPAAGRVSVAAGQTEIALDYQNYETKPSYSLFATTESGGNWLTVTPVNGSLPATVSVGKNGSGLAAGVYRGTVTVHVAGAANSPVQVPVTMTVGGPEVREMVNAASYARGAVAPGQIVTLFGSGLGPATLSTTGVAVMFDGRPAQVIYARADQVGVVAPLEIAGRETTAVEVLYRGQRSERFTRPVVVAAPGIFTAGAVGSGQGAIVNETGTVNGAEAPAERGSTVAIYLTGAGVTDEAGMIVASVAVRVGGLEAEVRYAGVAPGSITGLYQINAVVPLAVASGAVPVEVTVGGAASQPGVTVSVR
jgi:uncharacterized protein (TIGR03437 family)